MLVVLILNLSHVLSDFYHRKHFPFFVILIVRASPALCNFCHGKHFSFFFIFAIVCATTRQSDPVPWFLLTGSSLFNHERPLGGHWNSQQCCSVLLFVDDGLWRVWEAMQGKQTQPACLHIIDFCQKNTPRKCILQLNKGMWV